MIINNEEPQEKKEEKNYYSNNQIIKILIETYLETVDFSIISIKKNIKNNKVSLLLGLRLPGIYTPLKKIIVYIRNEVKNKYMNDEKDILYLKDEDENDFGKTLDSLRNRLKGKQRNCEIEIGVEPKS